MRRRTTLVVGQSTMQLTETLPLEESLGEALKNSWCYLVKTDQNILPVGIFLLKSVSRVYHMKPTGFEVISEQDCKELHYMYADEKKK